MGAMGLIAGEAKGADADTYPVVRNLVEDSFAHGQEGLEIGNSIVTVQGNSMKGKTGKEVHAVMRAIDPGAEVIIKLKPPWSRLRGQSTRNKKSSSSMLAMTGGAAAAVGARRKQSLQIDGLDDDDLDVGLFDNC